MLFVNVLVVVDLRSALAREVVSVGEVGNNLGIVGEGSIATHPSHDHFSVNSILDFIFHVFVGG